MTPRVAAVVLAAGSSSRLGRPKQLVEVGGKTLIRRTVETVEASLAEFVVVTTAENDVDFDAELSGLEWTRAAVEYASLGQSESVKAGVEAVEEHGGFDAVLFTPCDLPLLRVEHLNTLIETYRSGRWDVVASRYDGVLGAPLVIGHALWTELRRLQGDTGVRKILPFYRTSTTFVEWEGGEFDLDTPEDVRALVNRLEKMA